MIVVTAPSNISGVELYGLLPILFDAGVAVVHELPFAVRQYMVGAGYLVEELTPAPAHLLVDDADPPATSKPPRRRTTKPKEA